MNEFEKRFLKGSGLNVLIELEQTFGGLVQQVQTHYESNDAVVPKGWTRDKPMCQGGDRMIHSGYGPVYKKYLREFIGKEILIGEVGILKGTGLAIWNSLFPKSQIIGLDIDINNFIDNFSNLKQRGAFENVFRKQINSDTEKTIGDNKLNIFNFDQWDLQTNKKILKSILEQDKKIDIFMDDGDHQAIPNLRTLEAVEPHLATDYVYFIEDVDDSNKKDLIEGLEKKNLNYDRFGDLFVITKK